MAEAFFDMDALSAASRRTPKQALENLAEAPRFNLVDVVAASAQGVGGPDWDRRAHMLVRVEIAAPVHQSIQAAAGFDGFDLRRQLEGQKEGGFPETLLIKDTEGNRYRIVTMQGGDVGDVLVIERVQA